jgi:truncated hemoglobin YjbI
VTNRSHVNRNAFYGLVEGDELLAPVFGGTVGKEHRDHVLLWWVAVMGGPGGVAPPYQG